MSDERQMREGPERSVCAVIPSRDRPELLRRAIDSVLRQETAGLRVVVVDDGSADPIERVIGPHDARVEILRNEVSRGPAAARNQGASASDAGFIAFLDDDDTWLAGKLAACLRCFETHPEVGMVFHRTGWSGSEGGSGAVRIVADPVRRMVAKQAPHLDGVVVRSHVHDQVRFDETFAAVEDIDYLIRIAQVTAVAEIDRILAVHGSEAEFDTMIGVNKRIEGRRRLRQKHRELFDDPAADALYRLRLGHLYRRSGDRLGAMRCFAGLLFKRPLQGSAWKGVVASVLPAGLVRRFASDRSP